MGACQSSHQTQISHLDREATYLSEGDRPPHRELTHSNAHVAIGNGGSRRQNELKRASEVMGRQYPDYESEVVVLSNHAILEEKGEEELIGGDESRPVTSSNMGVLRLNGVKRHVLRRATKAMKGQCPSFESELNLRNGDVIHEESSGDEQEMPTPRKKLQSKAKLLRNVLIAVRKSNQPLPNTFYDMLIRSRWSRQKKVKLKWPCKPISIAHCHDQIWVAQDNAITAFTLDLEPVKFIELDENEMCIKHDLMYQIQALTEVSTGQIAVACGSGLHLLAKLGRYNGRISEGCYTDAGSCQGHLYAAMFDVGRRSRIQVYDEQNDWDILKVIKAPMDGRITINVSERKIIACSSSNAAIYITDLDGQVVKKTGSKGQIGTLGHFMDPRVCHGSHDGACVITETEMHQIYALSQTGELAEIPLNERVLKPRSAVVIRRHLYVLSSEPPYVLYRFV